MAKKRKKPTIKKRITRALKKFVRANPRNTSRTRQRVEALKRAATSGDTLRGKAGRAWRALKPGARLNPRRVKGAKVAGGRAVSLRNFTGRVIRKRDGTVQILGRMQKTK